MVIAACSSSGRLDAGTQSAKCGREKSPNISSACSSSIRKEFYDTRAAKQFLQCSVLYPELESLQVLPLSKVRQKDTQEVWGRLSATKRGHEIFSFGAFKLISDCMQLWLVYSGWYTIRLVTGMHYYDRKCLNNLGSKKFQQKKRILQLIYYLSLLQLNKISLLNTTPILHRYS